MSTTPPGDGSGRQAPPGGFSSIPPRVDGETVEARRVLERMRSEYWRGIAEVEEGTVDLDTRAVLILTVGDRRCAVPLSACEHVIRLPPLARLPHAPQVVTGALAFRGEVMAAVDLRILLGLEGRTLGPRARAVLVQHQGAKAGFLADRVERVYEVPGASLARDVEGYQRACELPEVGGVLSVEHILDAVVDEIGRQ